MTADNTLPDNPLYCFSPVEDPDNGLQQMRIVVEGMDFTIGTSLIVLGIDEALTAADRLNRLLGWRRETWTAFATKRLGAMPGDPEGGPSS